MRSGTVLPHKTGKLAILSEQGLKFRQITCTKGLSLGFIPPADDTEKENKNIPCSSGQPGKKYTYSTSTCLLKCTKNMTISSLLCPIIMVRESVHFLITLECLQF